MSHDACLEGVTFSYPSGGEALSEIDLRLGQGELVAIVGHNGSGKSTLLRHLNGLARPSRGRVTIGGQDIGRRRVSDLAAIVAMVFQDPDLQIFEEHVADEMAFGPRNLGWAPDRISKSVADALEQVGLAGLGDENPFRLGYSARKLVAIASAIAMDTPIVVLDEPTTGQDPFGIRRVTEVVGLLAGRGRTVVAASHDLDFVAEAFDRIVVLAGGRVILDGPPIEVLAPSSWPMLARAGLQPTAAARAGHALGLPPTPSDAAFVAALRSAVRSGPA